MTKATCSIEGCEKPVHGRGWCIKHYTRWRSHGDPLMVPPVPTPEARFWAKVDQHGPDGFHSQTGENLGPCWLWTAPPGSEGYGLLKVDGRQVLAHRFAYELLVGPVPLGLELDHLCRVRHCVNPAHLEPVTHQENLLRGDSFNAKNAAKTHCPAAHAYSPENTYVHRGRRECRSCRRARSAAYRQRQEAQRPMTTTPTRRSTP